MRSTTSGGQYTPELGGQCAPVSPYLMHREGIWVDVDVSGIGYRYITYSDDLDLDEFPDGEVAEESDVPLTLGEPLLLIETPNQGRILLISLPILVLPVRGIGRRIKAR